MIHPELPEHEKSVFEKQGTQRVLWILLILFCILSAAGGFVLAMNDGMHPHFGFDRFPAFYGAMGFVAFSFIVLAGQHLRKVLMRPETYYDGVEAGADHPPTDHHGGHG